MSGTNSNPAPQGGPEEGNDATLHYGNPEGDSVGEQSAGGASSAPVFIPGVDTPRGQDEESAAGSHRTNALDDIANRVAREQHGLPPEEEQPAPSTEDAPAAADGAESQDPPASQDPAPPATDLPDNIVRMEDGSFGVRQKVDGEEIIVPWADAHRSIQKSSAADRRLEFASKRLRDVEEREAALHAQPPLQQQPPPPPQGADPDLKEQAKSVVQDLLTKDPDEAAASLAELLGRAVTPQEATNVQQDAAELAAQVERQIDNRAAYQEFASRNADLVEDTVLFRMADAIADDVVAQNPDWSMREVLAETERLVRERVPTGASEPQGESPGEDPGEETPAAPPPADPPENVRETRKQNLQPMPASRSAPESLTPPPADTPQTPTSVIEEMKRARGQAV